MTDPRGDQIRSKPIWRLTPAELDLLSEQERRWAGGLLFDMKQDGTLAMLVANQPDTKYEVAADRTHGWVLRPLCTCRDPEPHRFIEAYLEFNGEGRDD